MKPVAQDYCEFLISTQVNFTQTYFADHHYSFSHDAINRFLVDANISPADVWKFAQESIVFDNNGCLIFDDSVLDKNHSHEIELVRKQYSGNAHSLIKGIGVVNCVYVNIKTGESWIIDWRIYSPDEDGKSKLDHAQEMFDDAITLKKLPFSTVLMDSWYATMDLMKHIHRAGKRFYCPIKSNRKVDDSAGTRPYKAVSELQWSQAESQQGKVVKLFKFPSDIKLKLFRVAVNSHRTDWVVTNDLDQESTNDTHKFCAMRWKIEQYHREIKQVLGIEKCQCRKARAQRNHIACAILAWLHLGKIAKKFNTTIYSLKKRLLSEYMRKELQSPTIRMTPV